MNEQLRQRGDRFALFISAAGLHRQRQLEAQRITEAQIRLNLLGRVSSADEIPEEIHYRVDFGKEGETDLIFNTREVEVYIDAIRPVRLGVDWVQHYEPILNAIEQTQQSR